MKSSKPVEKTQNYQGLVSAIEERQTLNEQRIHLKSNLSRLQAQQQKMLSEKRKFRNGIRGVENSKAVDAQEKLARYRQQLFDLELDLKKQEEALEKATKDIADADKRLAVVERSATEDTVITHGKAVSDATQRVEHLNELIAKYEGTLEGTSRGLVDLSPLYQRREDILADVAAGTTAGDDLAAVEAQIADGEKQWETQLSDKETKAADAASSIAGLRRKLAVAEQELERLNQLTPMIMDQFLMLEAEKAASDYQKQARQAVAKLVRLAALELLIIEQGERSAPLFLTGNQWKLFLPDSLINPVSGEEQPGVLISGLAPNSDAMNEALAAAREQFDSIGLIVP